MSFIITMLLVPFLSFSRGRGGDWVGNGGNVLSCTDSQELLLLDYVEADQRGLTIDLGGGATYQEQVLFTLDRLQKVNPTRADLYRKWLQTFISETEWMQGAKFVPVPDIGVGVIPLNCEVKQIAVQKPDEQMFPGDKRYIIDRQLWNRLSEKNKAGLVLHELIYREAITEGHVSSMKVRYFNQSISSSSFANFDQKQMLNLTKIVDFSQVDYYGIPVDITDAKYFTDGSLMKAQATGGFIKGTKTSLPLIGKEVSFYSSGALSSVQYKSTTVFPMTVGTSVVPVGREASDVVTEISFYEDGSLKRAPTAGPFKTDLFGQRALVNNSSSGLKQDVVEFWPDGTLKTGFLVQPVRWSNEDFNLLIKGNIRLKQNETFENAVFAEPGSQMRLYNGWYPIQGFINL